MKYLVLSLLFFIIVLQFSCNKAENTLKQGEIVPGFSLYTPDQRKIFLSSYRGSYLLIHFWADWCSQCRAEFPKLEQSYQDLKNENFEIIGINVGQSAAHVSDFIEHYKLTFPMIMDQDLRISKMYRVTGLPTNFFVNKKGELYKIIIGWVDQQQINKILKEMENAYH